MLINISRECTDSIFGQKCSTIKTESICFFATLVPSTILHGFHNPENRNKTFWIAGLQQKIYSSHVLNTLQSRFFESRLFEVPFRPSRWAVVKVGWVETEIEVHYAEQRRTQLRLTSYSSMHNVILQTRSYHNFKGWLALKKCLHRKWREGFNLFAMTLTRVYFTINKMLYCRLYFFTIH